MTEEADARWNVLEPSRMFRNVRLFCPAWLAGLAVAFLPKPILGVEQPISGGKRAAPTLENTLKTMVTITTL